jgi:hypothetical protein
VKNLFQWLETFKHMGINFEANIEKSKVLLQFYDFDHKY